MGTNNTDPLGFLRGLGKPISESSQHSALHRVTAVQVLAVVMIPIDHPASASLLPFTPAWLRG